MNDKEMVNDNSQINTYRATTNLNTAIENPQINMNSAVGVNIKNVDSNNLATTNFSNDTLLNNQFNNDYGSLGNNHVDNSFNFSQNVDYQANTSIQKSVSSFDNTDRSTSYVDNSNYTGNTNQFINNNETHFVPTNDGVSSYEPTLEEKKRPSSGIKISRELKILFFIVFILFIFILLMPYIYDFFKKLQLVLTTR